MFEILPSLITTRISGISNTDKTQLAQVSISIFHSGKILAIYFARSIIVSVYFWTTKNVLVVGMISTPLAPV